MSAAKTSPLPTSATLELGIDRNEAEAFQSQIARQIRELVLSGRLKPGARLPSSRALSEQLGVARATVVEAYEQLSGEGYVETRLGSGTAVAAELPEALLASGTGRHAPYKPEPRLKREPARPFRAGLVDWEHFPHDDWGRILGRYWRNPPITLLEHNDPFGWLPLRKAIAAHLFDWRGIACEPEQVIVTAGGSDAFDLVRRAVFTPGDQLWLEDPGYPTARRVFALGGVEVVPMAIDGEGLLVSAARQTHADARGAFVTPARQYPTGVTMPLTRRLELLAWAKQAGAIIIEDDYDSEYRYVGRPLPALMSLDRDASVIYSGTFSKVFSPIIRLGFIVVPKRLIDVFRHERIVFGAPPSLLVQPALAQFMEDGQFAVHIRRMRRLYSARRDCLMKALTPGIPDLFQLDAPPSGLMLLLRFAPGTDDMELEKDLTAAGLETLTLSSHYVGRQKQQGLLLSFAGFHEDDLEKAAARLISVLRSRAGAIRG
ncbi:MAG: PLP-dependent aminotransferase family protein [Phyllobacteriaceae bacterium]|nr:PLP-dependent aminotransferase family protein [Phyllobacteriaceae bacterium]